MRRRKLWVVFILVSIFVTLALLFGAGCQSATSQLQETPTVSPETSPTVSPGVSPAPLGPTGSCQAYG